MTDDDLKSLFDAARQQFEETANRLSQENRHFLEVAAEAFKQQVELIAERVIEELRRETADIRMEIRGGFAALLEAATH